MPMNVRYVYQWDFIAFKMNLISVRKGVVYTKLSIR